MKDAAKIMPWLYSYIYLATRFCEWSFVCRNFMLCLNISTWLCTVVYVGCNVCILIDQKSGGVVISEQTAPCNSIYKQFNVWYSCAIWLFNSCVDAHISAPF